MGLRGKSSSGPSRKAMSVRSLVFLQVIESFHHESCHKLGYTDIPRFSDTPGSHRHDKLLNFVRFCVTILFPA